MTNKQEERLLKGNPNYGCFNTGTTSLNFDQYVMNKKHLKRIPNPTEEDWKLFHKQHPRFVLHDNYQYELFRDINYKLTAITY
jgi:hypothetical protein